MNDGRFAIETHGLTRYFGRKCAVDQVSIRIPRGCVCALLGRNGSGKSTLVRMILGFLQPSRGTSQILGEDSQNIPPKLRGRIGYIAEGHSLIDWMRVGDLQAFQRRSSLRWNDRTFRAIIGHFRLDTKSRASQLSRGQRAGLSLALAMATEPELLIMDDPALGLDPVARRSFLEAMILLTRDSGNTILFSSHILDDVERVADHIAIMDRSVLRVAASVETFQSSVRRFVLGFSDAPPRLPKIPGLLQARRGRNDIQLTIANVSPEIEQSLRSLGPAAMSDAPVSLEDAVLAYIDERGDQTTLLDAAAEMEAVR